MVDAKRIGEGVGVKGKCWGKEPGKELGKALGKGVGKGLRKGLGKGLGGFGRVEVINPTINKVCDRMWSMPK